MLDIVAARGYIEAALEHSNGTHTYADVVQGVESGDFQFWPGHRSAVVTEILSAPQKRILNIFLAGGELAELEAMLPTIMQWGHSQGCTSATLVGRKGWERTFIRRHGWTPTQVVYEASICP